MADFTDTESLFEPLAERIHDRYPGADLSRVRLPSTPPNTPTEGSSAKRANPT